MPESFFEHRVDRYDGVTIKLRDSDLDLASEDFERCLEKDLSSWRQEGKAGVWICIPVDAAHLVPACAALGFDFQSVSCLLSSLSDLHLSSSQLLSSRTL